MPDGFEAFERLIVHSFGGNGVHIDNAYLIEGSGREVRGHRGP